MFRAHNFEIAMRQEHFDIGQTEIDQMARYVDSVPALAEDQELPAGRVRHLQDQAAIGPQELARAIEVTRRLVEVLDDMEHRDRGAGTGREGRTGERGADGRYSGSAPSHIRGVERKIQTRDGNLAALAEHLQKQSAAAADIENQALFLRIGESAFDEPQMIAQNESAIPLFETIRRSRFGDVPVIWRIIIAQLKRRWLGMQANQPAVSALDNLEKFCCGAIKPVGRRKKRAPVRAAAGGTIIPG